MTRHWEGSGSEFHLEWGGRSWTLKVDGESPGLRVPGATFGPLLGLEGVAATGRTDPLALSGRSLVDLERRGDRVEAHYAPGNWGELTVRAAWSPSEDDGVDLEIQAQARSVGELKAVEIRVASLLPEPRTSGRPRRWVEPRDARSAGLSYDGREPTVRGLTTLPPADEAEPLAPRVIPGPWEDGWQYIEMVHPHDAARRITEAGTPTRLGAITRYGLFGHDLERGVVLRGRLRGLWTRSTTARDEALGRYETFLGEPPPLGI